VLVVLVLATRAASIPIGSVAGRLAGDVRAAFSRPTAAAVILIFLAATASLVAFFPREGSVSEPEATAAAQPAAASGPAAAPSNDPFAQWWAAQPRIDLGVPADGAKVVVVKFNDFLCGSCAQAHFLYKPVFDRFGQSHPGAVKLVVKDWPWDTTCNFNAGSTIPGHESACVAAAAARMAQDRGKYDEMAEWLYKNHEPSAQQIRATAATLLGVTDFDREYALKLPAIRADIADGGALGVRGTPTYFINGVRLAQMLAPAQFERAISLELQR
jgi:protein-disulfide isomerase